MICHSGLGGNPGDSVTRTSSIHGL